MAENGDDSFKTFLEVSDALNHTGRSIYGAFARYIEQGMYEKIGPGPFFSSNLERTLNKYGYTDALIKIGEAEDMEGVIEILGSVLHDLRTMLDVELTEELKVELGKGAPLCRISDEVWELMKERGASKVYRVYSNMYISDIARDESEYRYTFNFDEPKAVLVVDVQRDVSSGVVSIYDYNCTIHGNEECVHVLSSYLYFDCVTDLWKEVQKMFAKRTIG